MGYCRAIPLPETSLCVEYRVRSRFFWLALPVCGQRGSSAPIRCQLPLSILDRVLHADVIVVGKVTELEKETVKANPFPRATEKADFQIAVVQIGEGLRGAKGLTTIRVGFQLPMKIQAPPIDPNGRVFARPSPAFIPPSLTKDQEGCIFLTKHPEADFYVAARQRPPPRQERRHFC